jgi:hypothetical protein
VDEVRVVFRMSYFQERLSEETHMVCYKHLQNVSLLTIFSYNVWLYLKRSQKIRHVTTVTYVVLHSGYESRCGPEILHEECLFSQDLLDETAQKSEHLP